MPCSEAGTLETVFNSYLTKNGHSVLVYPNTFVDMVDGQEKWHAFQPGSAPRSCSSLFHITHCLRIRSELHPRQCPERLAGCVDAHLNYWRSGFFVQNHGGNRKYCHRKNMA